MSKNQVPQQSRDRGVTLIELLVVVVMMGLLATSISAALIVTLRSSRANDGRLNVARAEQNVAAWMPADLSSAVTAAEEPDDTACGTPTCAGVTGSNALMLSWPSHTTPGTDTTVSYVYRRESTGDLFELVRVYCDGGSCQANTVLRALEGPEDFDPGVTPVPDEVIDVTVPLAATATEDTEDNLDTGSTARRIVVTINGGADVDGAGGGVNRVSITAGGTTLGEIEPEKVTGPSFSQARSRCGGPITIIVDDSRSIELSGGSTDTEEAVVGFVKALAGTPTSVKVVKFSTQARTIGSNDWDHRFDMSVPSQVETLVGTGSGDVGGAIRGELVQIGGTNWEDALYRTFYAPNGDRFDADGNPNTELPRLVVFFTDGIPTFNRTLGGDYRGDDDTADPGLPSLPEVNDTDVWPYATGGDFDQEGFDRTSYLLSPFRNTDEVRLIGVGVGGISTQSVKTFSGSVLNEDYDHRYYNNTLIRSPYWSSSWYYANYSGLKTVPAEKTLGNLIAGGSLQAADDNPYVKSTYTDGAWTNVETADMFITNDFDKLPSALSAIAVGQCGGTLTLQTDLNGSPAPSNVTYESNGETVTTSLISRAATFDVTVPGGAELDTVVTPHSLEDTGYNAVGWSCKTKGAAIAAGPDTWSPVDAGDPSQGINVRVAANQAVSCTLSVTET